MKGQDLMELQRRIDDGIRLAQRRLACRARMDNLPLIMFRGGEIVEMIPESEDAEELNRSGDPLIRYRYK